MTKRINKLMKVANASGYGLFLDLAFRCIICEMILPYPNNIDKIHIVKYC